MVISQVISGVPCLIEIKPESNKDRQEFIDSFGYDRGIRYDAYITYQDAAFVKHVDNVLPKKNIYSAIVVGKTFHDFSVGFDSINNAIEGARQYVEHLLFRLDDMGQPYKKEQT